MRIFSGNANLGLAHKVADVLAVDLSNATVDRFSDGEVNVQLEENVRGEDCFVIQPTCSPTDANLMELLVMLDALKRSSPRRVTAVIPYYGYARQDKQARARAPITAKLVADLIATAGSDRVMAMDLHAAQIQGFFNIPVDNLYAKPVLVEAIKEYTGFQGGKFTQENVVVVSPDSGGAERARAYAKLLDAPLAIIDKRREHANHSEVMHIIGDVKGRHCIVVDDMIDTAGTLCKGVEALDAAGAVGVVAAITHPVLSGEAYKHIANCSSLTALLTTDTIPLPQRVVPEGVDPDIGFFPHWHEGMKKVQVTSIAPLLAEAIRRTHNEESISSLFR
jgi:ribose-phosphate pyrophosphokinase